MRWTVTLGYDGAPSPNHGPVTHTTDDRVSWASVLICGDSTTLTLIAECDTRAVALLAARKLADQYASEVGLPVRPSTFEVVPLEPTVPVVT